ncbi:MAG TPA: LysR family transcriptional regulator, partial [Burkholderiaceae bacterium]
MIDDLRYLIVFAKVAETGSLTGAADALGLAPSTVSSHLAKLEKNLDCALLYRNTRKITLTDDGLKLLETAAAMLALYEKGVIDFRERAVSTAKAIRIALPAVLLGYAPFMAALAAFIDRWPGLQIDMQCSDLRDDVVGEGIDVAFRIGDLPDSGLKARPIFSFERLIVASTRYRSVNTPEQLADLPWIGLSMRPNHRILRHADGRTCEIRYTPRVRVDSVEASYRLAQHGVGLAAPPLFMAEQDL